MARRRRKPTKRSVQSPAALRQTGLRAFKRGDYGRAIEIWERVARQSSDLRLTSALAEAYFRRGLNRLHGKTPALQAGVGDLEQAAKLQPDAPRYAYHLGLAAHRQGNLDRAIRAYRTARKRGGEDEFTARAAYPLALALLQNGEDPASASVWSALSAREQAMLSDARSFRRRPYTLSPDAPLLWRGLAALDAGDRERALAALESVIQNPTDSLDQGMARYYLGVLAARGADWDAARRQWNAARAAGLATSRLRDNLGEAYHRLAEERLAGDDDVEGALAAATEALRHKPGDKRLRGLVSQAHQRLAYKAASGDQWPVALEHWEAADEVEGGSFRLAYNLALAYERAEEFVAAGEKWREALRRRPRRADHPDAISDEQVAQLWRRAAEAYTKAGEYDEAIHVYRQAVKWNPDNLDVRLALAEALLGEGRLQAAENELDRVLERDPNNVPALLRQGEVLAARGRWWYGKGPATYWERVLKLEPDHPTARQLLADFYQNQAEADLSWGYYPRAVEMYQKALEYQPKNGPILAALGGCYLRMDQKAVAQFYMAQALDSAPTDMNVYDEIIHAWLDVGKPDQAWDVVEKAEAAIEVIPYEFYITQAYYCIRHSSDLARPWLERAVEKAPPGEPVLAMIGEMAVSAYAWEIAQEYLERAIAAGQGTGQAYMMLGVVAAQSGDRRMADNHWREAERIARQERDGGLMERVRMARLMFSGPPGLASLLMSLRGASLGGSPFSDPDYFYDEDEDDEDFWD
jgi:tetratricopeptide (TPR) repeat protein